MDCKQECAKKYICKNQPDICGICISVSCVTNNYPCFVEKDLVEVVRCKDCIHWGGVTYGFVCRKLSGIETKICMGADHFCSYGERKE